MHFLARLEVGWERGQYCATVGHLYASVVSRLILAPGTELLGRLQTAQNETRLLGPATAHPLAEALRAYVAPPIQSWQGAARSHAMRHALGVRRRQHGLSDGAS